PLMLTETVAVWDATSGKVVSTLPDSPRGPWVVSWNGSRLARADGTGAVTVWDTATGQPLRTLTGHTRPVTSLTFTPDGRSLAAMSQDRYLRVWDVTGEDDKPVTVLGGPQDYAASLQIPILALSPAGDR